jgi:predicted Fe-Mo cluster-binding NifX family protein
MKIAITSMSNSLTSEVCPRFGRAEYFIIIDPETLEFEAMENPNAKAVGGAGIQSSQMMINQDVSAVVSGRVGMNAFRVLDAAGIDVYENVEGRVEDAVRKYINRELIPSNTPKPGMNRNRERHRGGENENKFNGVSEEIMALKKEVAELTKQLSKVTEELNSLNK